MQRHLKFLHDILKGKPAHLRSPKWHHVEKEHRQMEPDCAGCGKDEEDGVRIQIHHCFPWHYCVALGRPDLELDHRNLISECETERDRPCCDHHLLIGHLGDFKSANLNVRDDSKLFFGMTQAAIKTDVRWLLRKRTKLKNLIDMSDQEKNDLRILMDKTFPKISIPVDPQGKL